MIKECSDGYYSHLDPAMVFKKERDAKKHEITVTFRKQREAPHLRDNRTLNCIIDLWYTMHGKTLRDHVRLKSLLFRMSARMGNPIASEFSGLDFATYREKRTHDVSSATVNREHAYLRAVFNELRRLRVITYDNPIKDIRKFKEREGELRYLTHPEIKFLLFSCNQSPNKSLTHIVNICLATGARWSEAESLVSSQISAGLITFLNTKSGKNRSIPICTCLFDDLKRFAIGKSSMFEPSMSAFRKVILDAKIHLPKGQLSHVLRHSFASHFIINGGNIVVLKDILGHSEITTTMRYSHLAPEHLSDAVRLNPLNAHIKQPEITKNNQKKLSQKS